MEWLRAYLPYTMPVILRPTAVSQLDTFKAGVMFAKCEGIVPAPESAHAIRSAIDEALDAKVKGEKESDPVQLIRVTGTLIWRHIKSYLSGELEDYDYPAEEIERAMQNLPSVAVPS